MKYYPACSKCGKIVERDQDRKIIVCFECKRSSRKSFRASHKLSIRQIKKNVV